MNATNIIIYLNNFQGFYFSKKQGVTGDQYFWIMGRRQSRIDP
jgi:hypothetical protein